MQTNQIIYYVKDIQKTATLYSTLFDVKPIEDHPSYVCFELKTGFLIAFWKKEEVKPEVSGINVGSELLFQVDSEHAVDQYFIAWQEQLKIIQTPEKMEFGYNFVAVDEDNNRLRVYFSYE